MNCQKHPENEAVGTCAYCGRFFCSDCLVDVNGRNYCREHVNMAFQDNQQHQQPQYQQQQQPNIIINNDMNNSNSNMNMNYNGGGMGFGVSPKSRLVALLLCLFLGGLGGHRFYAGKIGWGVLYLFTGGLCGIGALVDLIMIITGGFTDQNGLPIKVW